MAELAPHHRTMLGRATIGDQLRRHARTQPEKVAFVAYDADGVRTETTYGALNDRANGYAQMFASRGSAAADGSRRWPATASRWSRRTTAR